MIRALAVCAALAPLCALAAPRLESVRDLRGGGYEVLRLPSQQVEIVRGGVSRAAVEGLELATGDAVRVARGAALIAWDGGERLELGDGSQVRLEDAPLVRVGEGVWSTTGRGLRLGDATWSVDGAVWFRVTVSGDGALVVLHGQAGAAASAYAAGTLVPLTGWQAGDPRAATNEELDGIGTWRRARFDSAAPRATRRDRAWVGLAGGFAWLEQAEWGAATLDVRGRLVGPLWLAGSVGLALRAPDSGDPPRPAITAVPVGVGPRLVADLPASLTIGGGVDGLVVVAERCRDEGPCAALVGVEPGVRFSLEGNVLPHARVGFGLQVAGGLLRHRALGLDYESHGVRPFVQLDGRFFLRL